MKNYNKILEAINKGIKFALDDFEDQEDIQGQVNSKVKYQGGMKEYIDLMNEVVDLCLPSGTLWCKYNLGVNPNKLKTAKQWYGKYYAWGETKSNKLEFSRDNYKFGNVYYNQLTKYCNNSGKGLRGFTDNLTKLLPEDDAAYQNKKLYNFKFHIPTKEQCEELIKYTQNYWVNNYNPNNMEHHRNDVGIKGLNGRVFIGKNGNQLFIPAAGYRDGSDITDAGSNCSLWSSNLQLGFPDNAYYLSIYSNSISMSYDYRYFGCSVRPIC